MRPALRAAFVDLCRGSVGAYLQRFGFRSELLQAMYATTDGFSGLNGGWDTPGSGHNFLVHNLCRLPGSGGTWMVVQVGRRTAGQGVHCSACSAAALQACVPTGYQGARCSIPGRLTNPARC